VSSVTDMDYMFNEAAAFNQFICWDLSKVATTINMFIAAPGQPTRGPPSAAAGRGPTPRGAPRAPRGPWTRNLEG
jgi:hypothetical protein